MSDRHAPVLIVDDDHAIRGALRLVLEDEGYDVLEAPDGLAALNVLRTTSQGIVVLLDLMMPRLDGTGVLEAVASDNGMATRHAFALITATSRQPTGHLSSLMRQLSVPVLRKPLDLDDLLDTISLLSERVAHSA